LRAAAAIGVAALVLAAGCGGDDGLSAAQRERLLARIDQVRDAAKARDAGAARAALVSFRASVRAARERGEISSADAERLLTGALQASRRVRAEITPEPTPVPTPAATPAPAPAPAVPVTPKPGKKPKDQGKAKGHEKGGKGDD
jgi:hypothetical protein